MPIKDRQKLITNIVETVLGEPAQLDKKFDWFINKHSNEHFGDHFETIDQIFKTLQGDYNLNQSKRTIFLECDAYFGGNYNLIFEFDEFQHFSAARLKTYSHYPKDLQTNYSLSTWKELCDLHKEKADKYRKNKVTVDFNYVGGRTAQRAYLDCFRDLLPSNNGLNPTLRISDFEVSDIYYNNIASRKKIESILKSRLN